jgi:DNA-binding IclR family transcriptional regulator
VFDDCGRLVLALTALGYKAGFDARWSGTVAAALREEASRVSGLLGHEPAARPAAAPRPAPRRAS